MQDSTTPPIATTVFFGANDAALSGRTSERQHVPLEEYKENLRKIVHHLKVYPFNIYIYFLFQFQFNLLSRFSIFDQFRNAGMLPHNANSAYNSPTS